MNTDIDSKLDFAETGKPCSSAYGTTPAPGFFLTRLRDMAPRIHCMTNPVTSNDCANILLACGAAPIMALDAEEVEEVVSASQGLCMNLGVPNRSLHHAMLLAGKMANKQHLPVVFDPVGAGATAFRAELASTLLREVSCSIIRGNRSEILSLANGILTHTGVDAGAAASISGADDSLLLPGADNASLFAAAKSLANRTGAVVIISGETDIITDGTSLQLLKGGHPMMKKVTGTGCQLSALLTAFAAANPDRLLDAACAGVTAMNLCGELAATRLTAKDGNASYRNYLIDAVFQLTGPSLDQAAHKQLSGNEVFL